MAFNRRPRTQDALPTQTVAIPAPPDLPKKPETSSWLTIALPVAAIAISIILMVFVFGSSSGLSYLIFLPMVLLSYLSAWLVTSAQKKNYLKESKALRQEYRDTLRGVEAQLRGLQKQDLEIRDARDPDPAECLKRANLKDPRLGERRPQDNDFLMPRIGTGVANTAYKIEWTVPSARETQKEFSKELAFANKLQDGFGKHQLAPIQFDLKVIGSLGIAGGRSAAVEQACAIIGHLATHHWLEEVQFGLIPGDAGAGDWHWLKNLPHYSPLLAPFLESNPSGAGKRVEKTLAVLEKEVQRRIDLIAARKQSQKSENTSSSDVVSPRLIILVDFLSKNLRHPAIPLLLEKGPSVGVHGIFLVAGANEVPGECGGLIEAHSQNSLYKQTGPGGQTYTFIPDRLSLPAAKTFAQQLASISWPNSEGEYGPPERVTLLETFSVNRIAQLPIEEWWQNNSGYGYLRAPIGMVSPSQPLIFDLNDKDNAHGPHGLLGGTTGSGKSEVLKAVILALAITHHPYDLNFALVDFKGGAAFNELAQLPHTVGVVTDIDNNATYAERVLQSLSGEIERRKRVIEAARKTFSLRRSHIDEYRQLPVKQPLPRLLVVFDEFAAFKARNEAESKKLVSIASQGRAYGVHLLLATQSISSSVDQEIMRNSKFRICLNVKDAGESIQMIGSPNAVGLSTGRAYFSVNSATLFQSAYPGADYQVGSTTSGQVKKIWPDGRVDIIANDPTENTSTTETAAVVEELVATANRLSLKKPPAVWTEPLPEQVYLPELLSNHFTGGWSSDHWVPCTKWGNTSKDTKAFNYPIMGIYDAPSQQKQFLLQASPEEGGPNVLVMGSAGTGKSTLLKSMVVSLALMNTPQATHVYILDYGGQASLKPLEEFPHVGAVITQMEPERTERLLQFLEGEMERRVMRMRQKKLSNWQDYNAGVPEAEQLPALYLLIDNFANLKLMFSIDFLRRVHKLASAGNAAGIFFVSSSSSASDFLDEMYANVKFRLTFFQARHTDYDYIVGRPSEAKLLEDATQKLRQGRGLLRGVPPLEFQAALPIQAKGEGELTALSRLAASMSSAWGEGSRPQPIGDLPLVIFDSEVEKLVSSPTEDPVSCRVVIGQDYERLAPVTVDFEEDGASFLVASTGPETGKTSFIRMLLLNISRQTRRKAEVSIIDFHSRKLSPLANLRIIETYVNSKAALNDCLEKLSAEVDRRKQQIDEAFSQGLEQFNEKDLVGSWSRKFVVVDDYDALYLHLDDEQKQKLSDILVKGSDTGVTFVASGDIPELPGNYANDPFIVQLRRLGTGLQLGGVEGINETFNVRSPAGMPGAGLPPGRGFKVLRGKVTLFQAFAYWNEGETHEAAVARHLRLNS